MTLKDTIGVLEGVAASQPIIHTIVRHDASRIADRPDWRYGIFAWQHGTHRESASADTAQYSFTLFYVDRLTPDKLNTTDVESTGCEVLGSILRYISENTGIGVEDWTLHPFEYRFKDECAGVWAEVTLDVPVSLPCGDVYDPIETGTDLDNILIY